MKEYLEFFKRYTDFNGVTSVRGFWMAYLVHWIISFVMALLGRQISVIAILGSLYSLATLIPMLAIQIRRFRDGGKSWANIFWWFLPVVGWIIGIVKLCAPSVSQTANN